jgi:hypothetical protein
LTVAELLRREGMTQEIPVVKEPVDDAPTDRIPVADLLRREGKWDRRRASKVGAFAAGVAALAGIAATALSAGHLHDTAAPAVGGSGGPSIDPSATTSQVEVPPSLAPGETVTHDGAAAAQSAERSLVPGSAKPSSSQSKSGVIPQRQAPPPVVSAPTAGTSSGDTSSSGAAATTTTAAPPVAPPADTTTAPEARQPAARTSTPAPTPTTPTEQPKGGLLTAIGGLLGGILGG